jgi:chromosome transmission fidelity protein 1
MAQMDDYINHLFSYVPQSRIMTLSCGHVIPTTNLVAWPIVKDHFDQELDFTFEKRNQMVPRAGRLLEQLVKNIPDGVVAFFPSYAYLELCVRVWKTERLDQSYTATIWEGLTKVKPIFMEAPRGDSGHDTGPKDRPKAGLSGSETLLSAYSNAILNSPNNRGALLLSVINGSLSEGINFSDRLGRGVIVFGLPFPNPHTPEWKAKTEYLSRRAAAAALSKGGVSKFEAEVAGKAAASEFYQNTAMRAVNQAVGRAIRHKNDYAAILVVDRRYGTERVQKKLPGWIRGSMGGPESVHNVKARLTTFFQQKAK